MIAPAPREPEPGPKPGSRPGGAGAPDESNRRERQGDNARPRESDRPDTAAEDASNRRERSPYDGVGKDGGVQPPGPDPGRSGPAPKPAGTVSKDDPTVPKWLKKMDSDL